MSINDAIYVLSNPDDYSYSEYINARNKTKASLTIDGYSLYKTDVLEKTMEAMSKKSIDIKEEIFKCGYMAAIEEIRKTHNVIKNKNFIDTDE